MKKTTCILLFVFCFSILFAQDKNLQFNGAIGNEDWTKRWTNYKPNIWNYSQTDIELSGVISNSTSLTKKNTYLLKGIVYVTANTTLTIEPGTVIRGDGQSCGTLVIAKGGKIIAEGTETDPIVFTSNISTGGRNSGDWGGIVIFGEAPINKIPGITVLDWGFVPQYAYYGGTDEEDNSGKMKYVRIEYSGRKINKSVEINGLTLAGVGKGTQIENIQISYSNDDSFEMFGGTVALKNIISYKCGDDDLDFNYGYTGNIQNVLAIRHPYISDFSGSRCIEADSYSGNISSMNEGKRFTKLSVSNLTLLTLDEGVGSIKISKEAVFIGPDCYIDMRNAIISGFESALVFKDPMIRQKLRNKEIKMENIIFNNCKDIAGTNPLMQEIYAIAFDTKLNNKSTSYANKELFIEANNSIQYSFKLKPMFMVSKGE